MLEQGVNWSSPLGEGQIVYSPIRGEQERDINLSLGKGIVVKPDFDVEHPTVILWEENNVTDKKEVIPRVRLFTLNEVYYGQNIPNHREEMIGVLRDPKQSRRMAFTLALKAHARSRIIGNEKITLFESSF